MNKKPQWTATLEQNDRTLIFGYFDGRPTADMLEEFFASILSGKVKSVGSYGVKGNNITIEMPPGS